jgi:hypothetical protein
MKRRFAIVLIFLLLGAIVNIAVAWGCAVLDDPTVLPPIEMGNTFAPSDDFELRGKRFFESLGWRPTSDDSLYTFQLHAGSCTTFGADWSEWREQGDISAHNNGIYEGFLPFRFVAMQLTAGWPSRSFVGEVWNASTDCFDYTRNRWTPHDVITVFDTGLKFWPQCRLLPLRPLWPGFAINTLFYAAILWLLFALPGALRRWRRIKHGLCPACAYPVGASDLCTECGKPAGGRL